MALSLTVAFHTENCIVGEQLSRSFRLFDFVWEQRGSGLTCGDDADFVFQNCVRRPGDRAKLMQNLFRSGVL